MEVLGNSGQVSPAQMATPGRPGAAARTLSRVQVVAPRILPQMVAPRARTQLAAPRTLPQTGSRGLPGKIAPPHTHSKVAVPATQTEVAVQRDVPGTQEQMVMPEGQAEMANVSAQMAPQKDTDSLGGPKHLVYKKVIKPLIEKKRRQRINASLSQLRTLLKGPPKPGRKQSHSSRLDKAHLLEMAVLRIQGLQQAANQEEGFSAGFTRCLSLIDAFLASQAQLGSTLQPKLAEYLSSALKPTHLENQHTALQLMATDGQCSALQPMQADYEDSALQLTQASHQSSVLQLTQARAGASALQTLKEVTMGRTIKIKQAENQDIATQPQLNENQSSALKAQQLENNGQDHHMSQTSNPGLMRVQNRCSVPQEKQAENLVCAIQLFNAPGPQSCSARSVMHEKNQNSDLKVPHGSYQSSALTPQFAQNHDNTLKITLVKNMGSPHYMIQEKALIHQNSKNQGTDVRLQKSKNQGRNPLFMQAEIQDSAVCTIATLKRGHGVQPLQGQNLRHEVKYQQNQTSVLQPQQITNQCNVFQNEQTQNYGTTLGHIQTQSVNNACPPSTGGPQHAPQIHGTENRLSKLRRRTPKKEKGCHDKENLSQECENQTHEQENIRTAPAKLWHSSDQTPSPWERPVDRRPQPWKGARRLAFTPPESESVESQEGQRTPINKRALIVLQQAREQWVRAQAPSTVHTRPPSGPPMACSPALWQCPSIDPMWRPW